ncbi:MAG TPA: MarR family transcriptional regulator [Gemmatimonadaceae bacterium]
MKTATQPGGATHTRPRLDPETEAALKLFVVLVRANTATIRAVDGGLAEHDLTPAEFGILEALYHKGRLLLGDLQRKVLVTSGGTTYLVDRLEAKGLVKREDCPSDRRARYANLTPAGLALIKKIFPAHAKRIVNAVAGLNTKERAEATRLLRKLGLAAAQARTD